MCLSYNRVMLLILLYKIELIVNELWRAQKIFRVIFYKKKKQIFTLVTLELLLPFTFAHTANSRT